MTSIILPASVISICMLVCFPHVSHVNLLVSHSLGSAPDITWSAA